MNHDDLVPRPLRVGLWFVDVVGDALDAARGAIRRMRCVFTGHHRLTFAGLSFCRRCWKEMS